MRAVQIDVAHLVVEWQLFHICLELFPLICFGDKNVTNKILNFFELVSVSFCVQEASLFSLAPHSLFEGGIF